MGPFLIGLHELQVRMTVTGFSVTFPGKVWFFDRVVWLFEDRGEDEPVRERVQQAMLTSGAERNCDGHVTQAETAPEIVLSARHGRQPGTSVGRHVTVRGCPDRT
jgi:hypothetical protein